MDFDARSHEIPGSVRKDFQRQDSGQTLREGLVEYLASVPGRDRLTGAGLPDGLGDGLSGHDIAHVVFGCDASVRGEVLLTRWSLFGVTGSLRPYLEGLRHAETRPLYRRFWARVGLRELLRALLDGMVAIGRSLRMRARWPFDAYAPHLDHSLRQIREEFGIRVLD